MSPFISCLCFAMPCVVLAARHSPEPLREFLSDPALTVACVLLIAVSVGWLVITRLITGHMRRTGAVRRKRGRDIWSEPPAR